MSTNCKGKFESIVHVKCLVKVKCVHVKCFPPVFKKAASVVSIMMNGQPKSSQCNFNSDICKL